jgi:hypothetical protein
MNCHLIVCLSFSNWATKGSNKNSSPILQELEQIHRIAREGVPTSMTPLETPAKLTGAAAEIERAVKEAHSKAATTRELVFRHKRLPEELKAIIWERRRLIRVVIVF